MSTLYGYIAHFIIFDFNTYNLYITNNQMIERTDFQKLLIHMNMMNMEILQVLKILKEIKQDIHMTH